MRKLITIFLLVSIPLALLYGLTAIVDSGLRKANLAYSSINNVFNSKVNADVLVCGSSRAAVHISPRILDSVLGKNSYNMGMSGWGFHMQNTMFKICMQYNKKPAYVVQVVDAMLFTDRTDFYEYELFLPYTSNALIRAATEHYKGSFTPAELYFPLFKYNNHLDLVTKGIRLYFGIGKDAEPRAYKGYWANDAKWDGSFESFRKANPGKYAFPQNPRLKEEFEAFLDYCKRENIRVVLVYTPAYYEQQLMTANLQAIKDMYRGYAEKYNVPLLDYTTDSLCYDKQYFYNSQHLNKTGAEIFSNKLATALKGIIKP